MPGGDRTGPLGRGPMTGRAAGFCAGYPYPGSVNPIPGRGYGGWGRGGGRGWRHWYYATGLPGRAGAGWPGDLGMVPYAPYGSPLTGKDELEFLRRQASSTEEGLKELHKRIVELESGKKEKK